MFLTVLGAICETSKFKGAFQMRSKYNNERMFSRLQEKRMLHKE